MLINNRNFDVEKAMQDTAFEYAKADFANALATNQILLDQLQQCLDLFFDTYVRAFGYLANTTDEYIETLLNSR